MAFGYKQILKWNTFAYSDILSICKTIFLRQHGVVQNNLIFLKFPSDKLQMTLSWIRCRIFTETLQTCCARWRAAWSLNKQWLDALTKSEAEGLWPEKGTKLNREKLEEPAGPELEVIMRRKQLVTVIAAYVVTGGLLLAGGQDLTWWKLPRLVQPFFPMSLISVGANDTAK